MIICGLIYRLLSSLDRIVELLLKKVELDLQEILCSNTFQICTSPSSTLDFELKMDDGMDSDSSVEFTTHKVGSMDIAHFKKKQEKEKARWTEEEVRKNLLTKQCI